MKNPTRSNLDSVPSLRIRGQLPALIVNGGGDSFWKRPDFQHWRLVTLTLDRVILHTVVHHSSTSTYTPDFIKIEQTFCGGTDVRTYVHTHGRKDGRTDILRSALLGRRCQRVDVKRWDRHIDWQTDGRHAKALRLLLDAASVIIITVLAMPRQTS